MFFIETIRNHRLKKKTDEISRQQLRKYFETGNALYQALLNAEGITGSKFLGATCTEMGPGPTFEFVVTYPVDKHLTVVFRRFCDIYLRERLWGKWASLNGPSLVNVGFKVDGYEAYDPSNYEKFIDIAHKSIMDKIYKYRSEAKEHIEAYLEKEKEQPSQLPPP